MRQRKRDGAPPPTRRPGAGVEANAVVSYNLRAIRERRGWTQQDVARRLCQFTGYELPQASVCNMERGFERGRPRRFDAHELYLLSVVFDVPVVYFFLPPTKSLGASTLADTGQPLVDLYAAALGTGAQVGPVDERLGEMMAECPDAGEAVLGAVFGSGPGWAEEFRTWRHARLVDLDREYGKRLGEIAAFLVTFAAELTASGPSAHLSGVAQGDAPARPPAMASGGRW